ncbi:hypothetical protein ACQ86N_12985 [Puia sp. P3]|uniref:hypothetical protein n=1 Tax=Puia sp. P3 TaxID=3423952 RepID=UPI003D6644E9
MSRQALHKYEKGEVIPDSEMMKDLTDALGLKQDYFFRESLVELGPLEFRKLKGLLAKEQSRIIELTKDVLSRYLELEEILGMESGFINPLAGRKVISTFEEVEKAAADLRKALGNWARILSTTPSNCWKTTTLR